MHLPMLFIPHLFLQHLKMPINLLITQQKAFKKDLGWELVQSMTEAMGKYSGAYGAARTSIGVANRLFIAGIREMNPEQVNIPDANSTMRMSYGSVLDYYPADAVHYDYFTTLKGVMQKEDPTNDEFIVEKKLKDLYTAKITDNMVKMVK